MTFTAGELVQLKSGGPAMVVTGTSAEGVHCLWYGEADDEVKTAIIPEIALEAPEMEDEEDEDEHEHGHDHKHGHKHG